MPLEEEPPECGNDALWILGLVLAMLLTGLIIGVAIVAPELRGGG